MASIERRVSDINSRQSELILKGSAISYILIGGLLTTQKPEAIGIAILGIGMGQLGLIEKLKRNGSGK